MAITAKQQAAIPAGQHKGVIVNAAETSKVFDPSKGPEDTVEITIQPGWRKDPSTETLQVSCLFSPVLNGLSAFSKLLQRLEMHPADGEQFDVARLIGREVVFTAEIGASGFVRVVKDSIRLK